MPAQWVMGFGSSYSLEAPDGRDKERDVREEKDVDHH